MKRVIISISILIAMVSLGIFFNIRISVRCNELIELTELIQENIENKSEALEYARQFDSEWESFHHESIFIIRGDRLSEIENCYIINSSISGKSSGNTGYFVSKSGTVYNCYVANITSSTQK